MSRADDCDPIAGAIATLHRAGWSVGDVAFRDGAGGLLWIVSSHNGENLIRAEGPTRAGGVDPRHQASPVAGNARPMTGPYYSNASDAPTVEPGRLPSAICVMPGPEDNMPIGIAFEAGRLGGYDWEADRDLGPREVVWQLVVGKQDVEGRFVLRCGRFVELAEDTG